MILCKDYFLHHICIKQIKIGKTLVFAWAAITKYHRLGGLNNRNLPITVVEAVKSNINVPAVLVPGEGSFPSLQTGNILLRAHMAFLGVCTFPHLCSFDKIQLFDASFPFPGCPWHFISTIFHLRFNYISPGRAEAASWLQSGESSGNQQHPLAHCP